jgi:hypothetical protein
VGPISRGGGRTALWSHDGREIFYIAPDRPTLMAVPVQTGASFSFGQPHPLFATGAYYLGGTGREYDVSLDGSGS